jgi:hypothetical protein
MTIIKDEYMYITLRILRGIFGIIFGIQLMGLAPVLSWFDNASLITAEMWIQVALKLATLAITGCIFVYSRRGINSLHTKLKGEPHPALMSTWSL